jgi:hypothetical protein
MKQRGQLSFGANDSADPGWLRGMQDMAALVMTCSKVKQTWNELQKPASVSF